MKLVIALTIAIFSAQSFATGTVDCKGSGVDSKGRSVEMTLFTNVRMGNSHKPSSDLTITLDKKEIIIPMEKVKSFKNNDKALSITAVASKKQPVGVTLSYTDATRTGKMTVEIDDKKVSAENITCDRDY